MAASQQDQDRTEQATPYKLREAKKKGQVHKSMEMNSFMMLLVVLGMLYLVGERFVIGELHLSQEVLSNSNNYVFDSTHMISLIGAMARQLFEVFWPLILAIVVVAIISNVTQTGPVFTFFPLKPDVQRLNPVTGFKKLFSVKLLFEAVKSLVKLGLFASVIYYFVLGSIPRLMGLIDTDPYVYAGFFLDNARELILKLLAVFLVIVIFDVMYSRWDFSKKMRMSRREIKDEIKRRDGDPQIKAKLRELQREAARRSGSLARVPEADVLITNPTHLSVALKYERGVMQSPEVIAKGAGEQALKMRLIARKNNIPIVEYKSLARTLFKKVSIDEPIPQELFPVVARLLVKIFAARQRNQSAVSRNQA